MYDSPSKLRPSRRGGYPLDRIISRLTRERCVTELKDESKLARSRTSLEFDKGRRSPSQRRRFNLFLSFNR